MTGARRSGSCRSSTRCSRCVSARSSRGTPRATTRRRLMRSLPAFRHSAAIVLVLLAATTVAAQEVWQVTKLRTQKVALYDCADPSKKTDFPHKDLQGPPWPITSGPTDAGMLVVKVGGADYCVRAYVVETNKAIAAK